MVRHRRRRQSPHSARSQPPQNLVLFRRTLNKSKLDKLLHFLEQVGSLMPNHDDEQGKLHKPPLHEGRLNMRLFNEFAC